MSGWTRALAIIMGLFVVSVGLTAIFYPVIVAGFVTALFSIAFIMLGLWALSIGISGQRTSARSPVNISSSTQATNTATDEGITHNAG